jgi:uncharacterized protein YndB with AHSA1/START domain
VIQPEPACLLIADISGYTEYLSTVEIDHAQDILADLIGTVVTSLRPGFKLAKLEGDAAFCFAPAEKIDGSMLLDSIERCYFSFRRRRRDVRQATSCECNACVRIPNLNLKFVAHHGLILRQKIAGREELLGADVIIVHRLLKNDVVERFGTNAYALLTDQLTTQMAIDPPSLGMAPGVESYEHVGEVKVWVHDLERRWSEEDARARVRVEPSNAAFAKDFETTASPQTVWEFLTTPGRRMQWQGPGGVSAIEEAKSGGRRGMGTVNHCMHGPEAIVEEILDWRPFDYLTVRSTQPPAMGAFKFVMTYELEPTTTGTILHALIERPRGQHDRQMLEQVGPFMAEQFTKGISLMLAEIDGEAASAPIAPAEPALPRMQARDGFLAGLQPIEYVG